jgi:hypothetical protein
VVTAFCDRLGEWTAAQITRLDVEWRTAGVLEIDWSGPEPASVVDLGEVAPLRLSHHQWNGGLSHCNYEWILPRSYRVIGTLPLLVGEPSSSYSHGWNLGAQLFAQRCWDAGEREPWIDPHGITCTGAELTMALADPAAKSHGDVRNLTVTEIESLDCARIVERYPNLQELDLRGDLGTLTAVSSLNQLAALRRLRITNLFGMDRADCLLPQSVPDLEQLWLHSIPRDYASAMRSTWRPEIPHGTYVDVSSPRRPDWVAENRDNPLREWDGREHISKARFQKAVTHYKTTRRAILAVLHEISDEDLLLPQLDQIGREYGEAFNALDGRNPFIETEEREELFAALDLIIDDAERVAHKDLSRARARLSAGVEAVRDW